MLAAQVRGVGLGGADDGPRMNGAPCRHRGVRPQLDNCGPFEDARAGSLHRA